MTLDFASFFQLFLPGARSLVNPLARFPQTLTDHCVCFLRCNNERITSDENTTITIVGIFDIPVHARTNSPLQMTPYDNMTYHLTSQCWACKAARAMQDA